MAELVQLTLVIVIMLGGMAMIVGGPSLTGRLYRWLFRVMVRVPAAWLLRLVGAHLRRLLRWGGRQLWRVTRWGARQMGRGIRSAWVRLRA